VSAQRTAWHFFFTILLRRRGPRWVEVRDEVPLSEEPLRLDYLLLRKALDPPADDPGQTLRGLWPLLPRITVAEFKSISGPYRTGNLDRLWAYVHFFCADEKNGVEHRGDLGALLVVPRRTPTLDADAKAMGLTWSDLGNGYWQLKGGLFALYVVEIDAVAEREDDDLLRLFGHKPERTPEARRFWAEQVGTKEAMMAARELEGYDEVVQKFLELLSPEERLAGLAPEQRLAGLAPEERLAGLAPEQRLAGLSPDQTFLALPDDVLRTLPEEYVASLPEPTREAIRKRLGR
jgi:hypothetical protein